ncbi:hypothetical protein MettiDRAFT_1933 [Methanolobus tindarius DSM 2278]|uniref:Uncharacterized protein n=1 Tax=Methanolobus tindarius DSM 2278 TaxID=1090322 RepID=W9DXM6_METTI|nr:hypothetical protein [Methanolobus tindarius]ETA68462.1 hypothetical protein MettiDRAFT_1933 [Methanolobus tindarius DSM 2278]
MSVLEYDSHITIEEEPIAEVRNPDYCVRSIELENIGKKLDTPFKILSGDGVTETELNHYSTALSNPIFESARFLQAPISWAGLEKYLTEYSSHKRNQSLRDFFKIKNKQFWDKSLTTLSLSFPRNPFEKQSFKTVEFGGLDDDSYLYLLNFIHANSSAFVLVPDIKIETNDFVSTYLEKIDFSVKILSDINSKPIFVPLPLTASENVTVKILQHYKQNKYSNIWINFNDKPCDSNFSADLRSTKQLINKYMDGLSVVLHCSHIKRGILPHLQDTQVASSDVLTQFFGADFIGVKRFGAGRNPYADDPEHLAQEALKNNFDTIEQYQQAKEDSATRMFDPTTYYYHNLDEYSYSTDFDMTLLRDRTHNKIVNDLLIHGEVESVKKYVEENADTSITSRPLKKYLQQKKMIQENLLIKDALIPKTIAPTLSDLADILGI